MPTISALLMAAAVVAGSGEYERFQRRVDELDAAGGR